MKKRNFFDILYVINFTLKNIGKNLSSINNTINNLTTDGGTRQDLGLEKAIEIAPKFVSALINRGGLKDENGDYQGAITDYETVLKLDKLESEEKQQAYFNLGNTYFNLKDKKKACENWNKALENGAEYAKERINEHCK